MYTLRLAAAKCSAEFGKALVMGFLCNLLVTIAVLLSLSAKDLSGRVIGAYMPVCFFVICGFEHSVANMYYVTAGLFALKVGKYASTAAEAGINVSVLTWGNFLIKNLLPVTIGNIAGGVGIGALMWLCFLRERKINCEHAGEHSISLQERLAADEVRAGQNP
jgi:formate/nitrite transporter FocA (FNT family)